MRLEKTLPPCHRATLATNKNRALVCMYMYNSKLCISLLVEYLYFSVWHSVASKKECGKCGKQLFSVPHMYVKVKTRITMIISVMYFSVARWQRGTEN